MTTESVCVDCDDPKVVSENPPLCLACENDRELERVYGDPDERRDDG